MNAQEQFGYKKMSIYHLEENSNYSKNSGIYIKMNHLRYFAAASELGSLRKASSAVGVGESTISRAIRDLEDKLGASLFHRSVGGVTLTIAGERFLHRVRIILQQIEFGVRDVSAIGRCERGVIRMGISASFASGFLANLLRSFDQAHADIRVEIIDGNPIDHVAAIRRIELDIAFVKGEQEWPDCASEVLWHEKVLAVLPGEHILVNQEELGWIDLAGERIIVSEIAQGPDIHNYLLQRFLNLGCVPEIVTQLVGQDNLNSLVAIGRGLTLTTEANATGEFPRIVYRPIVGEAVFFSAVWSSRNDNPALRRLLSMARTMSNISAS